MVQVRSLGKRVRRFGTFLLRGSWDLVHRVISKVTIVILTYSLILGTHNPTY